MLKLSIAIATLLSAVSSNTYWRSPEYKNKFERDLAARNHTRRRNQDEQLYVHLIAHTHDDVGWKKTVDEYYDGAKQSVQLAEVGMTISTVVESLISNPERRFTYVEMKFFSMWYNEQTDDMKEKAKKIIKDGRLEFVNAGWSMHDEACPHFEDMINNMMYGH